MTSIYIREGTVLPERIEHDVYETEPTLIEAALRHRPLPRANSVLDIGAGDGRWGLHAFAVTWATVLHGVDIRDLPAPPVFTGWYPNQDFLTWEASRTYDLVVSNPPYAFAEKIVRKAWSLLNPGGAMVMLLRLAFLEGVERHNGLWVDIPLTEVAVCSRRPSFYGGGKTNGTCFGLFFWDKNEQGEPVGNPRSWKMSLLHYERSKKSK